MPTQLNQTSVFCSFNTIPAYARFQWINNPALRKLLAKLLKPNPRGRKGYDKVSLLLWLMYKQLVGCTYRDLESITDVDYTTFIKFRARLIRQSWFQLTFEKLSSSIAKNLKELQLIIDSSFVQTYSKRREQGSEYFGYKEKNGFKLHQVIDYKTRLPIIQETTPGARADVVWGRELIRGAPKDWRVTALLADKGYDSDDLVVMTKLKWKEAKIAIPMRWTSQEKRTGRPESELNRRRKGSQRSKSKKLYNKRTAIERYFSRKKGVFNLGEEKTRGLVNFEANCYLTSIMEILEWVSQLWVLFTKLY